MKQRDKSLAVMMTLVVMMNINDDDDDVMAGICL